ncbi:MAG: hypothetical protein KDN05_06595 [Verrucomicrobiae bacterium]|nr:hypothetical protein [Verrucomicrobiae bacterium]
MNDRSDENNRQFVIYRPRGRPTTFRGRGPAPNRRHQTTPLQLPEWLKAAPPYAIGSIAAFWVIERTSGFFP